MLGHTAPVSQVLFNPHGNLIISGSKDRTVKFWDVVSGVCVKTYSQHLGEVTSVAMNSSGTQILTASKVHTTYIVSTEHVLIGSRER